MTSSRSTAAIGIASVSAVRRAPVSYRSGPVRVRGRATVIRYGVEVRMVTRARPWSGGRSGYCGEGVIGGAQEVDYVEPAGAEPERVELFEQRVGQVDGARR